MKLQDIIIIAWQKEQISEGKAAALIGVDRLTLRTMRDELLAKQQAMKQENQFLSVPKQFIKVLHTQIIELDGGKNLVFRIQDNFTVDVTIELSETECYGVEVPISLFHHATSDFLDEVKENL